MKAKTVRTMLQSQRVCSLCEETLLYRVFVRVLSEERSRDVHDYFMCPHCDMGDV